jgi:hypothetical protein
MEALVEQIRIRREAHMSFSWHCEYFRFCSLGFKRRLEGSFNPIYKDNDKESIERVRARLGQMTGRQLRRPWADRI